MATKTKKVLSPLRVGNNVLIRTVTHYHTGRIEILTSEEVVLSSAAWIADTGQFADCLKNGVVNECEPFASGIVSVARGTIVDVTDWTAPLPTVQK